VLKRMLNCPERITYHRLNDVCARRSAQVYVKVRLADVLPVEGSGLSERLYEFALQAHYDFVITDSTQMPLFAVEFDGPNHSNAAQVERDARKDGLSCRFSLPLLRVSAVDLQRSEWQLDWLTEVTERWFNEKESERSNRLALENSSVVPPFAPGSSVDEKPLCSLCGSGMVLKNGKYGPFLSCARFPGCRGSRDLPRPSTTLNTQVSRVDAPTPNIFQPGWLVAGAILFGLVLASLGIIFARSRIDGTQVAKRAPVTESARRHEPTRIATDTESATVRQNNLLGLIIRRRGWDTEKRDSEMGRVLGYNCRYSELNKQEASKLITAWDDREK